MRSWALTRLNCCTNLWQYSWQLSTVSSPFNSRQYNMPFTRVRVKCAKLVYKTDSPEQMHWKIYKKNSTLVNPPYSFHKCFHLITWKYPLGTDNDYFTLYCILSPQRINNIVRMHVCTFLLEIYHSYLPLSPSPFILFLPSQPPVLPPPSSNVIERVTIIDNKSSVQNPGEFLLKREYRETERSGSGRIQGERDTGEEEAYGGVWYRERRKCRIQIQGV